MKSIEMLLYKIVKSIRSKSFDTLKLQFSNDTLFLYFNNYLVIPS